MGKDKSLLPFFGKELTKYQYEKFKNLFDKVYISTKTKKFSFDAPFILDSSDIFAPTPAFLDIFKVVDEFFSISVDTPFIDEKIVKRLIEVAKKHPQKDAIIAKTAFSHPLIGIYRKSILPIIKKEIKKENYKLNHILKIANSLFVEFDEEEKFFNINYPKDYEKALLKSTKISHRSN